MITRLGREDSSNSLGRVLSWLGSSLIISAVACTYAQAQWVFPLAAGNTWHYTINFRRTWPPPPAVHYTIRVTGDSLMPNGKRYWIFDLPDMFGESYIRSDSSYIYYWSYSGIDNAWSEKRVFNLGALAGEIDSINWAGYGTVNALTPYKDTVFRKFTTVREYGLGGIIFGGVTMAENFGYTSYEYDADYGDPLYDWLLQGCVISDTTYGVTTSVAPARAIPSHVQLLQNYPNPFNGSTRVTYTLSSRSHVRLIIWNVLGEAVATLVDEIQPSGRYSVYFQPNNIASGVYYCQLSTRSTTEVIKLLYAR